MSVLSFEKLRCSKCNEVQLHWYDETLTAYVCRVCGRPRQLAVTSADIEQRSPKKAPTTSSTRPRPFVAAKRPVAVVRDELVFSHPTMCLHCHLIVEMFHERGADPVRGSWQCQRCNHKYLFSHWKIKRNMKGKTEAE